MEDILNEIRVEREKQNSKWGEQNHSIIEWQAILMEEVGEAAKEATDFHFKNKAEPYYTGNFEDRQKQRLKDYRKELIQTAAVAVQMIECLDRNGK